jgi:phospholipid/cholesterol/gamma-HCH transport system substrate-binding protein
VPKPLKIRRANEIAGLFIILGLAIVLTAVLLGPRTRRWFTPTRTVTIRLPAEGASGLRAGADVQILGSVVGSVDDITVTQEGVMEAQVSVRGDFIRFVRIDSVAVIRKPLGIGDAMIEITRGRGDPVPLGGAVLAGISDKAPTQVMEDTLNEFRNEALPAIKEARAAIVEYTQLASDLRGERADLHQVLVHLDTLGKSLEQGNGLAGMVLHDPGPPTELRAAVAKINASLDEVKLVLEDTRKVTDRLPETVAELNGVIKSVRETSDQTRQVAASLPELQASAKKAVDSVPPLLLQVQETSRQIQRLTEALQRSWLIRGSMDTSNNETRIRADRVGTDR